MPPCSAAGCGCENFQPQKLIDTKCRICLHWITQHGAKPAVSSPPPTSRPLPPSASTVRIPAAPATMTCSCGTVTDLPATFCVECGAKLGSTPAPKPLAGGESQAAEAMRIAAQKAALDKAAVDKIALEREATKKAGAEKLAQAKAEKLLAEKLASERALAEKAAAEKLALGIAEREHAEREAEEKLRAEREIAEQFALIEREKAKIAAEKLALERAEKERVEKDRLEKERIANEKLEAERLIEKAKQEKAAAEKFVAEKKAASTDASTQSSPKARGPPPKSAVFSVPAAGVGDDVSMADAIKMQLPGRADKWPGWTKLFEDEDIDTVGDLRRLTQPVWLSLNLSALVRSALEELRLPPAGSAAVTTTAKPADSVPAASTSGPPSPAKVAEPAPIASPPPQGAPSSGVQCATCGANMLRGAMFCGKCGSKTAVAPLCECGVSFLPGAAFCGKCGKAAGPSTSSSLPHQPASSQPLSPLSRSAPDPSVQNNNNNNTNNNNNVNNNSNAMSPKSTTQHSELPKSRTQHHHTSSSLSKTQSFSPRALLLDDASFSKTQVLSPRILNNSSTTTTPSPRSANQSRSLQEKNNNNNNGGGYEEEEEVAMASDDSDDDNKIVETGRERRETIASLTSTLSKPFTVTKGTAYGVRQTRVIAIDDQSMTIKFCAQNLTLRSEVPISQFTLAQVNEKRLALSFNKRARIYDLTFADAQECTLFINNYQAARKSHSQQQQSMITRSSSSVLATSNSSIGNSKTNGNDQPVNHQEYCVIKKNQYNQRQSRIVVLKPKSLVLLDGQHKFKKSFPYHHLHSIEISDSSENDTKKSNSNGGSSNLGDHHHNNNNNNITAKEAEAFLLFEKSTGQRPFQLFFADAFERTHFSHSLKTLHPALVMKENNSLDNELRFVVTKLEVNAISSCREGKRRMLEIRLKEGVIRSYDRIKQFKDTQFYAIRSLAPCPFDSARLYIITRKRFAFDFPDHISRDRFLAVTTPLLDQVKGISSRKISIFCGTWNMGSSVPTADTNLNQFLPPDSFDVYAIGMQECPHTAREAWVTQFKNQIGESKYVLVGSAKLWEISLAVFVRRELAYKVSCREAGTVASGVGDVLGNKGGAAVCMRFEDTTICFVCTHLAAQSDKVKERRDDFLKILRCLRFGNKELDVMHYADHVLWLGDLNYRVEMFFYDTVASCERKDFQELLSHDQLRREMTFPDGYKCVFPNFKEGEITFAPTYRWEKTRNVFSNKKDQSPSYTDRVLWHTSQPEHLSLVDYGSAPDVLGSDHRPVFATFAMQPRSFAWARDSGSAAISLHDVTITSPQLDASASLELLITAPFLSDDVVSEPRSRKEGGFQWEQINFTCALGRSSLSQFHLLVTVRVASQGGADKLALGHGSIVLMYQEDRFNCLLTRDGLVLGTMTGAIFIK